MTPDEQLLHAAAEYRKATTARDDCHARWKARPPVECHGVLCRDQIRWCGLRATCAESLAVVALDKEITAAGERVRYWRDAVLAAALIEGRG
jgi:hypothetical protein